MTVCGRQSDMLGFVAVCGLSLIGGCQSDMAGFVACQSNGIILGSHAVIIMIIFLMFIILHFTEWDDLILPRKE